MTVLHQSMSISKAGLSSVDKFGQNIKEKDLMCQNPIKVLKHHARSSYQNFRDLYIKKQN